MTSLSEAREYVREHRDEGVKCPCCGQLAKIYRRNINAGMAKSLIVMYRNPGWIHVPTIVGSRSREEGKLAYWDLAQEETTVREDGGRAGYWRITTLGVQYACNEIGLPKYAMVYNGKVLELTGPATWIEESFKSPFHYRELMDR